MPKTFEISCILGGRFRSRGAPSTDVSVMRELHAPYATILYGPDACARTDEAIAESFSQ